MGTQCVRALNGGFKPPHKTTKHLKGECIMNKNQLIKKYMDGELKCLAKYQDTYFHGFAVYHIEHGMDDKVFGVEWVSGVSSFWVGGPQWRRIGDVAYRFFFCKLHGNGSFRTGNQTLNLRDFIRENIA